MPPVGGDEWHIYARVGLLIRYFATEMNLSGNPGSTTTQPAWHSTSVEMQRIEPNVTAHPTKIKQKDRAWWSGRSCILTDGQWEYFGICQAVSSSTFSAWWVLSSEGFVPSLKIGEAYPKRSLVKDVGTATLQHAEREMIDFTIRLLTIHRPTALDEFKALREL